MNGRECESAVMRLVGTVFVVMTMSRWQRVRFFVLFAMPWVIGEAFILLQAVRFVFRVWEWLT